MPSNLPRGTPGLLLLAFAIAVALIALRGRVHRVSHAVPVEHASQTAGAVP